MKQTHLDKLEALFTLLHHNSELYHNSTPAQKQFIETTFGAALFYMPKSKKENFTGYISEEALLHPEKRCEEHHYPRKWAAQQLLTTPPVSVDELQKLLTKFLSYNYTTKEENRKLVPFQKVGVFVSPEHSYSEANIKLVKVSNL